jgi:L-asparaginase / beta-aspartyl-peptidase
LILIVHGGAGKRKPPRKSLGIISECVSHGYGLLKAGASALDAVVEAIKVLEDSGAFNAGSGGNLQWDGTRRLDASVMEGKSLRAGSVVGIERIKNPISAARILMDFPHIMMTNRGAAKIARAFGLDPLPEVDERTLKGLERNKKRERTMMKLYTEIFSTVGAVALDGGENLAAGTSTGGISAMLPGRVGDSPVIGAGVYAENGLGAISCTGMGESILRLALAKEICMNLAIMPASRAVRFSLKRLLGIGGSAGVIVIDSKARKVLMQTTDYMASGYADKSGIRVGEKGIAVGK